MTSKELVAFLRGEIDSTALPAEIELDKSLWQSMDDLWQRSVQHVVQGKVTEWGGTLMLDAEDRLQLVNVRPGTSGYVAIESDTLLGQFVGSFHTHPYPDGTTGIGFSGADIADTINSGELLSIVQSGQEIFALLRTEFTPARVNRLRLQREHDDLHYDYLGRVRSVQIAVHYTNADLCEAYGLAFYTGLMFHALEEMYRP